MTEPIKLKSRAVEIYDFRQLDVSRFIVGFTVDEAQLQKDLDRVLRRFGRREDACRVERGDTVTITCQSEEKRYNKTNIPVLVGKNLFNRELEEQMADMEKGEKKTLTVGGTDVTVEIVRISHTVLPELTDENVAAFGMVGVTTVDDLRRYCIARQVDAFMLEDEAPDMASAFVWQEMAKRSRIERDPEESARANERAERKLQEMSADAEDSFDTEAIRNIFLTELDLAAAGENLMAREGKTLTTDDYTAYIYKLAEAYPDRTREELEYTHDKEHFAIESYANYLAEKIDDYVAETFRKKLVK